MSLDSGFFSGVAPYGSPDYYALLFSPQRWREELRVLLALEHILAQISTLPVEADVRQAKLGWWAEELLRLSRGEPRHPVAVATHEILSRDNLTPEPILTLFAAIVREVSEELPGTPDALLQHAGKRGSMVTLIASALTASKPLKDAERNAFEQLGRARFVAMELGAGHRHPTGRGHANGRGEALRQLALRQRNALDAAVQDIPTRHRAQFGPLLVLAGLLGPRLDAMVAGNQSDPSSNLSRLVRAWRIARRASRGKLPH